MGDIGNKICFHRLYAGHLLRHMIEILYDDIKLIFCSHPVQRLNARGEISTGHPSRRLQDAVYRLLYGKLSAQIINQGEQNA